MPDPLVDHYVDTLRLLERLILRRAPWPLSKSRLDDTEVEQIAALLAEAHTVAAETREAA